MELSLKILWNDIKRDEWDRLHDQFGGSYQQDWAYGAVLAEQGAQLLRCVVSMEGEAVAIAQITAKPFAMFGTFALTTHGPAWKPDQGADLKLRVYQLIKSTLPIRWPKLLIFTPDEEQILMAGVKRLKRVMTGEATVKIDLKQDEETLRAAMDQKWRNRLKSAEKSDLKFAVGGTKPSQYNWLLNLEETQRDKRGYRALPAALTLKWQEHKANALNAEKNAGIQVFRADLGKDCAGAMLVLEHGHKATYHIGWSSDEGRKLGAHNLCLWQACLALKSRGFTELDLGGVNTQSGAGIARFKIGTGGKVFQRIGAYV